MPPHDSGDSTPWPVAYFGAARESWRDALAAITALGGSGTGTVAEADTLSVLWLLTLDKSGRINSVAPMERRKTALGLGKAKSISLSKLHKNPRLARGDAAVAGAIKADPFRRSRLHIDAVAAQPARAARRATARTRHPHQRGAAPCVATGWPKRNALLQVLTLEITRKLNAGSLWPI